MKIIHFADLHIGSKFERMPDDIKTELNTKLRNAFAKIIDYAKENNITTILMAGDIFDKNSVLMKDKKFFYDLIKANSEIDFYYIKGNHDSLSKYNDEIDNLHTFDGIKSYLKGNVRIIGYELTDNNSSLYNVSPFTTDKYNIMMLHGDIKNQKDNNYIDLKKLQNKNVNYFALGHIHKREDGKVGDSKYAYPGCVLGRGFDEVGEKGFLVLDTETNTTTFYGLSDILFEHIDIQVNGLNEAELKKEISTQLGGTKPSYITEIRLTGKSDIEIDIDDLKMSFKDKRYYLTIKNASKQALSFNPNENENSLRNMFINKVLNDPNLDDDTKEKVISYGLSKLMKEEE
jgi:DNA repair exonuclease SbcCD nuclease subunit